MGSGESIFVGVDAGGSHSEAVVTDRALTLLAREQGPAGAIAVDTVGQAADSIVQVVQRAIAHADRDEVACALVVGAAGAGGAEARERLHAALARRTVAALVEVTTDAAIAYTSVFGDRPGMLLIAGSGSIAFGRDAKGGEWRAGGLGWQRGDEGSGYAIGLAAVKAVALATAGIGPATTLAASLPSIANVASDRALLAWADTAPPGRIASLARTVQSAADERDAVATRIVEEAATALVDLATQLMQKFRSDAPVPLALWGGVLSPGSPVRQRVTEMLREAPSVTLTEATADPALGAASLAVRIAPGAASD